MDVMEYCIIEKYLSIKHKLLVLKGLPIYLFIYIDKSRIRQTKAKSLNWTNRILGHNTNRFPYTLKIYLTNILTIYPYLSTNSVVMRWSKIMIEISS